MSVGVVVAGFGFLESLDDLEDYLGRIMGLEDPPPEAAEDLRSRYEAIGGPGPLAENTRAQVQALDEALGPGYDVELGCRHNAPFLDEAGEALASRGHEAVVSVALAPQYNWHSVVPYHEGVARGLGRVEDPPPRVRVRSWADAPPLVDYWAEAVDEALGDLPDEARAEAEVIFTAHSLPKAVLEAADPYPRECRRTAEAVADAADLDRWTLAYQSGRDCWLEPGLGEALEAAAREASALVLAPVGFVAEHLETLYDLDVEARERAGELGLPFARARAPNADPRLVEAMAGAVRGAAGDVGARPGGETLRSGRV